MKETLLYQDIGKRIKSRRKDLGLTQEQLAELIDVTPQMISTAENGSKGIRPENIIKLSRSLDISCDYLLTGESSKYDFNILYDSINQISSKDLERLISILNILKHTTKKD